MYATLTYGGATFSQEVTILGFSKSRKTVWVKDTVSGLVYWGRLQETGRYKVTLGTGPARRFEFIDVT
jgi:hypothetical protein